MTGRRWHLVLLGAFASLATTAAGAPPGPDSERGQQTFEHWCAPCHAPGPGHPGTQSLEVKYGGKLPAALEQRTDLTPEVTRYFVRHGVSVMPFFRETEISEAQLKDLGAYLAKPAPKKGR